MLGADTFMFHNNVFIIGLTVLSVSYQERDSISCASEHYSGDQVRKEWGD